jgi:hypothetical protein
MTVEQHAPRCAFFILGSEGSGTRMLTRAFVTLGAFGDYTHRQRLDNLDFGCARGHIVLRRTIPHDLEMPPIARLVTLMEAAGFERVVPILIVRDKDATARSQVKQHWVYTEDEAKADIAIAIEQAYLELASVGMLPMVVHYEPFVKSADVRRLFFNSFGLPEPAGMEFVDASGQRASPEIQQ